ncbi:MAG: S8 family serine peptidase, partial [Nanoarchaeota archaeon]|nr:S8 family serine peptidase [Nanoarchaeota archaeon]
MKKNKPSKITGFFTAIVQTKTPREKVLSTLSKDEFKKKHEYSVIEGFSGEITEEGLEKLRNDPNVEKIYFDRVYSLSLTDSVPLINASKVHSYQIDGVNITGDGESVCILDTGVDTDHPSLKNNIIACETFVDGTSTCEDDSVDNWGNPLGHGTHVSGIVAGNGNVIGVAPGANIIAIKVCDSGGLCDSSDILAGLEWCTNNKDTYNISVISLSLGDSGQYNSTNCPEYSDSPGYAAAYAAGIFITAASGNNHHTSGISYPSCNENVTSAGAVTKSDSIDSYTNRGGNILTLLAPGSDITSTANGGGTTTMSGTSMATPHIAGAAAVLQQYAKANSAALTQTQIENALNNTGKPIYDAASDNTYGRISLFEAVKSLTDNSGPELNINSPANSTYNNNISLSLSYSASDVNDVDSIWYNFNGEENNFLTGDTTFNITEGSHVLNLYANDSLGNENSISVDFTVDITLVINLLTQNDSYVKNPVTFEFSLIDPNPDSCSLYGDWNGWHLNETKSYTENNFTINLEDGTYIWNIKCNDTKGNETF